MENMKIIVIRIIQKTNETKLKIHKFQKGRKVMLLKDL